MSTRKPRRKRKPLRARRKLLRGKRPRTKRKRRAILKVRRKGRRVKSRKRRRGPVQKRDTTRRKVRRPAPTKKRRSKRLSKIEGRLLPTENQYRSQFRKFLREPTREKRRIFAIIRAEFINSPKGAMKPSERVIPYAMGYLTRKQLQRLDIDDVKLELAEKYGLEESDIDIIGFGALLPPKRRKGMKVYKRARKNRGRIR